MTQPLLLTVLIKEYLEKLVAQQQSQGAPRVVQSTALPQSERTEVVAR